MVMPDRAKREKLPRYIPGRFWIIKDEDGWWLLGMNFRQGAYSILQEGSWKECVDYLKRIKVW